MFVERKVEVPALAGAAYGGRPAPGWTSYTVFKCDRCGRVRQSTDAFTTGYGRIETGGREERHCFACCGEYDAEKMRRSDRHTLYLSKGKDGAWYVSNWPGSLRIRVRAPRKGSHNMAGSRYDVWFTFAGRDWHGVQYGENTQILHCRKLRAA